MTAVHKINLRLVKKDGSILAFLLSVVPSYTNIVISIKQPKHIAQLWFQHLLSAEYIRMLKVQLAAHHRTATCPTVATAVVITVLIPNVVRPYVKRLRRRRDHCHHG
jgi:hypothetical protein